MARLLHLRVLAAAWVVAAAYTDAVNAQAVVGFTGDEEPGFDVSSFDISPADSCADESGKCEGVESGSDAEDSSNSSSDSLGGTADADSAWADMEEHGMTLAETVRLRREIKDTHNGSLPVSDPCWTNDTLTCSRNGRCDPTRVGFTVRDRFQWWYRLGNGEDKYARTVWVDTIDPKSPAAAMGLKVGDRIVAAQGLAYQSAGALTHFLRSTTDNSILFNCARDPPPSVAALQMTFGRNYSVTVRRALGESLGLKLRNIDKKGIRVAGLVAEGVADRTGQFLEGDLVYSVNGAVVPKNASIADFVSILKLNARTVTSSQSSGEEAQGEEISFIMRRPQPEKHSKLRRSVEATTFDITIRPTGRGASRLTVGNCACHPPWRGRTCNSMHISTVESVQVLAETSEEAEAAIAAQALATVQADGNTETVPQLLDAGSLVVTVTPQQRCQYSTEDRMDACDYLGAALIRPEPKEGKLLVGVAVSLSPVGPFFGFQVLASLRGTVEAARIAMVWDGPGRLALLSLESPGNLAVTRYELEYSEGPEGLSLQNEWTTLVDLPGIASDFHHPRAIRLDGSAHLILCESSECRSFLLLRLPDKTGAAEHVSTISVPPTVEEPRGATIYKSEEGAYHLLTLETSKASGGALVHGSADNLNGPWTWHAPNGTSPLTAGDTFAACQGVGCPSHTQDDGHLYHFEFAMDMRGRIVGALASWQKGPSQPGHPASLSDAAGVVGVSLSY